jgi:hypothetical protein
MHACAVNFKPTVEMKGVVAVAPRRAGVLSWGAANGRLEQAKRSEGLRARKQDCLGRERIWEQAQVPQCASRKTLGKGACPIWAAPQPDVTSSCLVCRGMLRAGLGGAGRHRLRGRFLAGLLGFLATPRAAAAAPLAPSSGGW